MGSRFVRKEPRVSWEAVADAVFSGYMPNTDRNEATV
jgi:hypothetical protein